jgi:hypothetical protein
MDELLSKYTRREGGDDTDSPIRESAEDFVAFGWLRGIKARANMLELRKKSGQILAVGYSWIDKVEFEPGDTVTLHLSGQRVTLKGRGLNDETRAGVRLFEGLTRARVTWIQEATQSDGLIDQNTTIDSVEW